MNKIYEQLDKFFECFEEAGSLNLSYGTNRPTSENDINDELLSWMDKKIFEEGELEPCSFLIHLQQHGCENRLGMAIKKYLSENYDDITRWYYQYLEWKHRDLNCFNAVRQEDVVATVWHHLNGEETQDFILLFFSNIVEEVRDKFTSRELSPDEIRELFAFARIGMSNQWDAEEEEFWRLEE